MRAPAFSIRSCNRRGLLSRFSLARTVAALVSVAAAGCPGSGERGDSSQAEERLNLISNPSLYLQTYDREYSGEDGGVGDRQLTAVTVMNRSHFAVRDLQGDVVWLDGAEQRIGSTPFSLRGTIGPGTVRRFMIAGPVPAGGDGTLVSEKLHGALPVQSVQTVTVAFTRVKVD
jgi:hypothetical protein